MLINLPALLATNFMNSKVIIYICDIENEPVLSCSCSLGTHLKRYILDQPDSSSINFAKYDLQKSRSSDCKNCNQNYELRGKT